MISAVGACLSEDEAVLFAEGGISAPQLLRLNAHLDTCSDCRALVAAAAELPGGDSPEAQKTSLTIFQRGDRVSNRYRVERFIARGGMGEVYEATDELLGERLALKTIAAHIAEDHASVKRLKDEVLLSRRISHPSVCRVFDLGTHELGLNEALQIHFLTMELLQGPTLGSQLRAAGPLSEDEALKYCEQLLHGLTAAHDAGVLHRDFKSDNVLLHQAQGADRARAVITDFGLARITAHSQHSSHRRGAVGSAAYMAPEQVEGRKLSAAADVYSLGVVAFEMVTGALPFVADTAIATALLRLRKDAPRASSLAQVSPAWDEWLGRCLERNPETRFQSAREALSSLQARVGGATDGRVPEPAPAPAVPAPLWSYKRTLGIAASVTALAGVAIFAGGSNKDAEPTAATASTQVVEARAAASTEPVIEAPSIAPELGAQNSEPNPKGVIEAPSPPARATRPSRFVRQPPGTRPGGPIELTPVGLQQPAPRPEVSAAPTPSGLSEDPVEGFVDPFN